MQCRKSTGSQTESIREQTCTSVTQGTPSSANFPFTERATETQYDSLCLAEEVCDGEEEGLKGPNAKLNNDGNLAERIKENEIKKVKKARVFQGIDATNISFEILFYPL